MIDLNLMQFERLRAEAIEQWEKLERTPDITAAVAEIRRDLGDEWGDTLAGYLQWVFVVAHCAGRIDQAKADQKRLKVLGLRN